MNYEICQVPTYKVNYDNSRKSVKPITTIEAILQTDVQAHERLSKNDLLKLSVDVDKLTKHNPSANLEKIFKDICEYVSIDIDDISYTTNFSVETGSHHIVIPKYFMKSSDQKQYWKTFREQYRYGKEIDADIFDKDGWFRLPNQTKEGISGTEHIIQKGVLKDFVLKYVEEATIYKFIQKGIPQEDNTDEETNSVISDITITEVKEEKVQTLKQDNTKWVQEIQYYIENGAFKTVVSEGNHLEYIKFGGMLLSAFSNDTAFKLWEMATLKNGSANKKAEYIEQFKSLKPLENDPKKAFNILKKWVKKDDAEIITSYKQLQNIPSENSYNKETEYKDWILEEAFKYGTEVAFARVFVAYFGENFKATGSNYKTDIWYFDESKKIWNNDTGLINLRLKISDDLFKIFKNKLIKLNLETQTEEITKKIKHITELMVKLEKTNDKNNIAREICDFIIDMEFEKKLDNNKNLFAFNNCVLDLKTMTTRPIKFDDYISITCGYDYNPDVSEKSLAECNELLNKILPDKDVLKLYLQLISCGLVGECIEKFVVLNGGGGNGKGLLSEFVKLIYGDYGYIYAPVCLLTEKDKTGANPEKVKLHRKRIVMMKEPSGDGDVKLKNDRIRDITGGGNISGRDLYAGQKDCEIELNQILFMECNKRPLFESEPEDAERRRLIDILFPSKFTDNVEDIDNVTVFQANKEYKTDEWKIEHRDAFLQILLNAYKSYKHNGNNFNVPESVKKRTEEYINKSFPVMEMFLENYQTTEEEHSFILVNEFIDTLHSSQSYSKLNKKEQRKFNKSYIVEFFSTNKMFKKIFFERKRINGKDYRSIIMGYKLKEEMENEK